MYVCMYVYVQLIQLLYYKHIKSQLLHKIMFVTSTYLTELYLCSSYVLATY